MLMRLCMRVAKEARLGIDAIRTDDDGRCCALAAQLSERVIAPEQPNGRSTTKMSPKRGNVHVWNPAAAAS